MRFERVGVIGGGLMGSGIAEVAASAGCSVIVHEVSPEAGEAAQNRIIQSLDRAVSRGKLEEEDRRSLMHRIDFSTDLGEQSDRELIIEAVPESESLKVSIFEQLDEVAARDDVILASNTSSIPITRLAAATSRPERVVGLHFFNPVPVMSLVELITTPLTDDSVAAQLDGFASEQLVKTVIRAKDRGGFIVNLLLVPFMLGAVRLYEAGHATAEDIDAGMRLGANHPMGPLELADFVGLDTMKLVADVLFEEYKEPLYASPPLLTRMVEAGLLGRKSGQGFYRY